MARDYSPTHFYLRVPNHLLERYFKERHKVLEDIEFKKLKENKKSAELIFHAVLKLPNDKQAQIEAECQEIESMAFHSGITALIEEATNHPHFDKTFPEAINKLDGDHAKAMWTYLDYPQYWLAATSILHAQNISDFYWKRRNDFHRMQPNVKRIAINNLTNLLRDFFRHKEGRGRHCKIDVFRRSSKEYFFVNLSNFAQSDPEWDGNILETRARLPVFEIIFVCSQSEGTLDIYAPGNTKYISDLQKIFANAIFGLQEIENFSGKKRAYNLDLLADRDFTFIVPKYSNIESVVITRLRLTLMNREKRRITIEADTKRNPKAIYDTLSALKLPASYITQADITVTFKTSLPGTRIKNRKFTISYPDLCNLRHEGRDGIIRTMLAISGIELIDIPNIEETALA